MIRTQQLCRRFHVGDSWVHALDMVDLQNEILKELENLEAGDREGIEEVLESLAEMEKMRR